MGHAIEATRRIESKASIVKRERMRDASRYGEIISKRTTREGVEPFCSPQPRSAATRGAGGASGDSKQVSKKWGLVLDKEGESGHWLVAVRLAGYNAPGKKTETE